MSISFLPAEMQSPSAPNDSAARDFCADDKVLRVPNQAKLNRIANIVVRSRWAGAVVVDGSATGSSSNDMLMAFLL